MKFQLLTVFLFALLTGVFTSTADEDKIAETCQKETKASDDDMKILGDTYELPETKTQYCLLACFYKATGCMDANNKLVYDKAVLELEPLKKESKEAFDKIDKILKQCITNVTPDKDQCESVKKYIECITKGAKEVGVDI